MFGSDQASPPYERIPRGRDEPGYGRSVTGLVFRVDADRVLGL